VVERQLQATGEVFFFRVSSAPIIRNLFCPSNRHL
jgi:hypothetical protein